MTPRRVAFQVYGVAKPKGSARGFVAMKAGAKPRAIVTSDNAGLKAWEAAVRAAAQLAAGPVFFDAAIRLAIAFTLSRPKSVKPAKRPHAITKPDLSKLIRGAEDALTGVLFRDDAQIVAIVATKAYADGPVGALITLEDVLEPFGGDTR